MLTNTDTEYKGSLEGSLLSQNFVFGWVQGPCKNGERNKTIT